MRGDTKELFKRLDIESFKYLEFEGSSSSGDVWPIFEAVMLDERVVDRQRSSGGPDSTPWNEGQRDRRAKSGAHLSPSSLSESRRPPSASRGPENDGIFSGYGATGENRDPSGDVSQNRSESVRAILGRLQATR